MKKRYIWGIVSILLTFGFALTGCPNGNESVPEGGGSTFDGATLAGTKWVAEAAGLPFDEDTPELTVDMKTTLAFTSDTAGNRMVEITKWSSGWEDDYKAFVTIFLQPSNGAFSSEYDKTDNRGKLIFEGSETLSFTVDVAKKELTITDEDGEKTVLKLQ